MDADTTGFQGEKGFRTEQNLGVAVRKYNNGKLKN
jgi:hypothetical protein